MKRYLVLPLALLVSSPAYSMKKMEPKNWVQQSNGKFKAEDDQISTVYQNPIHSIGNNKYELKHASLAKPAQEIVWQKAANQWIEQTDVEVSSPLMQNELTTNPHQTLIALQNQYVDVKNALEQLQKEGLKDKTKAIEYARLLLEKQTDLDNLNRELMRRKAGKEVALLTLDKTIAKRNKQTKFNNDRLAHCSSTLERQAATLETRKKRLEQDTSNGTSRPAGKRSMLTGTLVLADDALAEKARQEAIAEELAQTQNPGDRVKIARQLVTQNAQLQSTQAQVDQRLDARKKQITTLKNTIDNLNKDNQKLAAQNSEDQIYLKTTVNDLDTMDNWLKPQKTEAPRRGLLSFLGF